MRALKERITIVIVTHNMQQATRVADYTAFMNMNAETRAGQLIEFGETEQVFNHPAIHAPRRTSQGSSAD